MPAPHPLLTRWKSPAGKIAVRAIENALRAGTTTAELHGYVRTLPQVDEVAPALDLRAIALPELIAARKSDLSGARFDRAKLTWNFGGSTLREAVFDAAEGRNADFGGCDLAGSRFQCANLAGAVFFGARLNHADLAGIRMRAGQLKSADCRGADFSRADLRQVWAADADLRGAKLDHANLIGASLGGAQWDEGTRCAGAQFSFEGTPAALLAHALAQGASVVSEKPEWQRSLLEATRAALASESEANTLLGRFDELRRQLHADAAFNWFEALQRDATVSQRAALTRALRKAANNTGALLG